MITPGRSSAGSSPKKTKVQILLIQSLDEYGRPIPGKEQYAIATLDVPPTILFIAESYKEAVSWAMQNGYALSDAPKP